MRDFAWLWRKLRLRPCLSHLRLPRSQRAHHSAVIRQGLHSCPQGQRRGAELLCSHQFKFRQNKPGALQIYSWATRRRPLSSATLRQVAWHCHASAAFFIFAAFKRNQHGSGARIIKVVISCWCQQNNDTGQPNHAWRQNIDHNQVAET